MLLGKMLGNQQAGLCVALFGLLLLCACDKQADNKKPFQPESLQAEQPLKKAFVDEQACIACHQSEFKQWQGSHHDLAMDQASSQTVLGDFADASFSKHGITSTFFQRDDKFFVHTDGKDGALHDFEIAYVFGVTPLQQYLIKFPDGRMQALDIAWDTRAKEQGGQRWFHLHPNEKVDAKHPFHWTKRFANWNFMCAECHSTNVQKNFDLKSNTFKTTWKKIDVGCQACHGPGSNHVNWAKAADKSAWQDGSKGLAVNLSAKRARTQVESCARCHARRSNVSAKYKYGKPLMDFYQPQILREPFYYPDGQIKDEVYVYGSFMQSKMHAKGVRCTDCHNAHTSRIKFTGNKLCISCHSSTANARFPSLKKHSYDSFQHHKHKQDSKGALCASCHMPERTYMGIDPRKDHSFRIPRPDLSLKTGAPNACTQCHKNETNDWAAKTVATWYPESAKQHAEEIDFSEIFASAQSEHGQTADVAKGLVKVAQNKQLAAIIQATAASLLEAYPSLQTITVLQGLLKHTEPLVRYHAIHSLAALIPLEAGEVMLRKKHAMLMPLLNDSIRAVRTEAARALADVPKSMFSSVQYSQFQKSLQEYKQRQQSIEDRPESHLNMGLLHQRMGEMNKAEAAYQAAIRLAPDDLPAHFNLANLYHAYGKNDKAEKAFRDIIGLDENNGEAYYSLGLLLAEESKLSESVSALKHATALLSERPRVRYNYALSLKKIGNDKKALKQMLRLAKRPLRDPMMIYVLTTWLAEAKRYEEALPWAKQLVKLVPDEDGAKHLLIDVRNKMLMKKQ